jgi:hypothetical protein
MSAHARVPLQGDFFLAPADDPLLGVQVHLEREIDHRRPCHGNFAEICAGRGPHAYALFAQHADNFAAGFRKPPPSSSPKRSKHLACRASPCNGETRRMTQRAYRQTVGNARRVPRRITGETPIMAIPKIIEPQTTELASINDNDAAALTALARELQPSDLIGLLLKFVKGKWFILESKENEREVGAVDTFVVDPISYAEGWIKWENKKPAAKLYARRVDGWIAPSRNALPDQDQSRWPVNAQGPQDPWQRVQYFLLKDLATGELLTWQSTTYGGSGGIGEFLDEWAKNFKNHPGEDPIVLLHGTNHIPIGARSLGRV